MYLGQVVETGTKRDIFEAPRHPYTRALLAATLIGQKERGRVQRIGMLSGEVTRRSSDFVGCKLYGRCRYAKERCAHEPQTLRLIEPDHWARCWRAEELAESGWTVEDTATNAEASIESQQTAV